MSKRYSLNNDGGVIYSELSSYCDGISVKLISSGHDLVQRNKFVVKDASEEQISDLELYVLANGRDVVDSVTRGDKTTITIY